jgi:ABC-2 type transport system permease protein
MKHLLSSMRATSRAAMAEQLANKRALMFQVGVMIFNDLAWVGFWVIFFRAAGSVGGWDRSRIFLLQAVLTTAGGIVLGLLSNARHLGALAADGRLDEALTLPVHPLGYLLLRRVEPTNLGDTIFGVGLFAVAGHPTPTRTLIYIGSVIGAVVLLTSFLVLVGSLSFFIGRSDASELGFHTILLLGNYPLDLFGGGARLLVYSVVPAAFISTVPAKLIDHFEPNMAVAMAGITTLFAVGAFVTFSLGLRRYSSGSIWTRA